jgi:hypothetical protein
VQVVAFYLVVQYHAYPNKICQADQPFPEEVVQSQLDEDLAIPDSVPSVTSPPSNHDSEIEPLIAPQLSPLPSPVGTDYVDEHVDLPESPPLHDSPDPLDIITPAEDDGEPSLIHKRAEAVQSSLSPSQHFQSPDSVVSAEPRHSSVAEPPVISEVYEAAESLEHLKPSEVVECSEAEVESVSDLPATASLSRPVESEQSGEDGQEMVWKDDISTRSPSVPAVVAHAVESPLPLEGATTSAVSTSKICSHTSEPEGKFSALSTSGTTFPLAEASGMKEEIEVNENQPEETRVKQEDKMEVEQEDGHEAASAVAEQPRHDRKHWKSSLHSMLTIPDKRKVSEAASIFSDSARDRKRTREESQPVDEDDPGMFPAHLDFVSQSMNRSCTPPRPPTRCRLSNIQEIPNCYHYGSFSDFPTPQWQHLPQPHQNV